MPDVRVRMAREPAGDSQREPQVPVVPWGKGALSRQGQQRPRVKEAGRRHAFQSYVGLLTTENSTGAKVHTGGVTKTGNALVRKLLVEASWLYLRPRMLNPTIASDGVPAQVAEHARKGCMRLKKRAAHLQSRGKKGCVDISRARRVALGARDHVAVTPGKALSRRGIRPAAICSPYGPCAFLDFSDHPKRKVVITVPTREYKTLNLR